MTPTVVLGSAIGYRPEQVEPFLRSLSRTDYTGSVVLLVNRSLERSLRADPIIPSLVLVRSPPWLPVKLGLLGNKKAMRVVWTPVQRATWAMITSLNTLPVRREWRRRVQSRLAEVSNPPMDARFIGYLRYLRRHPHAQVLLCDVRDVLFQANPFDGVSRAGLSISLETDAYTIATEIHNARWITRVYGPEMLERIGNNRVANAGVTFGERKSILVYLERMTEEVLRLSPSESGLAGADSAIHNVLVWTGQLGDFKFLAPLVSPVATLNGIEAERLRLDRENRLLNEDGSCPSVIHQYDRQPVVREQLLEATAA